MGAYIGAVLLLAGFIKDDVKVRRIACVGAFVLTLITIPVCMFNKGYRSVDYVQDFKDGVDMMKEHYILTEHKGVDFDALYEKYLPMFEEANKNHDPVANYIAWCCFVQKQMTDIIILWPRIRMIWKKRTEGPVAMITDFPL